MSKFWWRIVKWIVQAVAWIGGIAGATQADWLRWAVKMMPILLNPWVWVALITVASVSIGFDVGRWIERRRSVARFNLPEGTDVDASVVLDHIANKSKWGRRELRRLVSHQFIDAAKEFRRAALEEGLRLTGVPREGGAPQPIDSRHWIVATLDERTLDKPNAVGSTFPHATLLGGAYNSIRVRADDVKRIWPEATTADQTLNFVVLGAKHGVRHTKHLPGTLKILRRRWQDKRRSMRKPNPPT